MASRGAQGAEVNAEEGYLPCIFMYLLDLMSSDLRNFCNYINVINYKIAINREKNKFQSSGFFQLSIQQGNCQI